MFWHSGDQRQKNTRQKSQKNTRQSLALGNLEKNTRQNYALGKEIYLPSVII